MPCAAKPVVVESILASDAVMAETALRRAHRASGLVELRADRLPREAIVDLVRRSRRSLIVTVRRREEGGGFEGSEERRRERLLCALEAGARFIDVEWASGLRDLAEGALAERVILSHHGVACRSEALLALYHEMRRSRAGRLKIVADAGTPADVVHVRDLLRAARGHDDRLACFAAGRAGATSRLLAPSWGSWASYGSSRTTPPAGAGQFPAAEMLEVFDVLRIGAHTRRFALLGRDVLGSPSPAMHRRGYRAARIDACYFPLELDRLEDGLTLLGREQGLGVEGLGVTLPFKEEIARRCTRLDPVAAACGAVNTVRLEASGWSGFNTDGPAMLALVAGAIDPRGARVAVVGAGGTAAAAAAVLGGAGARVCLYNRSLARAREAARRTGASFEPLERLASASWDVLVQATPLGKAGEEIVPARALSGRVVLDAAYGKGTPLVRAARRKGLVVFDGVDLLVAQGVLQMELLTGTRPAAADLRQAARRWLRARQTHRANGGR
jgi:3-dehydroquinate dehydratase/shikimate dehydrogenase